MKRKILITGGAGHIGGSLASRLVADPDNNVVIVDDLSTGFRANLPSDSFENWTFIKADVNDVSDITAILASHRFDTVFHFAAVVGVQRTLENPVRVLNDIDGIRNILKGSKNSGVQRVFYASSSEVYGEPVEYPQNEQTTPLNSRLPYAIIKNLGESFCRSYHQEFGLHFNILRFFNTYGPRQTGDFVITRFIQAALTNQDITVYGDGSQTRTFCFIDDNIDVSLKMLEDASVVDQVVNVGSDLETSVLELAQLIIGLTNSSSKIVHLPPLAEGDMTRRRPDITRMRKILGRELTSLEDGLKKTIEMLS